MRKIISLFVTNSVFANALLFLIMASGIFSVVTMRREILPNFAVDTIQVSVPYPSAGPEEVEEGICLKIEDAIEGLDGIKEYNTIASEGMGSATIEVKEGEDVQTVKDRVADRINAINTFPEEAEKPTVSEVLVERTTLLISIASDEMTERQLKELAEEIKDELVALPEISQANVGGTRPYEISIEVSEEQLRKYGITFADIDRAVASASMNLPGGDLRGEKERVKVRTLGRRYTGKEYADIVVLAQPDGTVIRLGQIADIKDAFTEDEVVTRFNGRRAVSVFVVNGEDEDAILIAEAAQKYVAQKQKELPPSVTMTIWGDSSNFIRDRIDLLVRNGRIGLVLVFILLWLFLDLRLAFWVSMGIPISFAGGIAVMYGLDVTINMISLFALIMVLGIVVDDAIVVGEAIYVQRRNGVGPLRSAVDGTVEVFWPVVAAVITTIVAFIPLLFIKGVMGNFIGVIPTVVIATLSVSLVEALIILPAHLNHLPDMSRGAEKTLHGVRAIPVRIRKFFSDGIEWVILHVYRPSMKHVLSWRYLSLAGAIATLFLTVGLVRGGFIKFIFFPQIDSDFITANVEFPEGTPLDVTGDAVLRLEEALKRVDERFDTETGDSLILAMESSIGSSRGFEFENIRTDGSHKGEIRVELLGSEQRGIFFQDITRAWEEEVGPITGATSLTIKGMNGGPGGKPIEIWLLGDDMETLQAASEALKNKLEQIAGVYQIEDDFRPGKRELRARLKPEAHTLGLTTASLASQLRSGYYGAESVRVQRGRDEVKVYVRYPGDERRNLGDVDQIRIRTPSGDEVPIASVADLSVEPGYTTIRRKDGERRITVSTEVDTAQVTPGDVLDRVRREYLSQLPKNFPGVSASLEGQRREQAESFGSLKLGGPLTILAIYLILATIFRSYLQPLIILFTIPFGIIGAVFGHMALGYDLTIMSVFGMVALAGVVVNDAIILIEAINHRLSEGVPFFTALLDGGCRRFRPIILTSTTTVGGLMPLLLERSMQAQFLIPMGLTIAAGVMFATFLTLGVIPCLLFILNDMRRFWVYLNTGRWPECEDVEPAAGRKAIEEELHEGEITAHTV
ncbi:efflux RND transporter permease subunit [bacterium]|nr:efflux RND transporter permease subunit [bacterium]